MAEWIEEGLYFKLDFLRERAYQVIAWIILALL